MSPQSRSGGDGGMHMVGYDGSQLDAGGGGTGVGGIGVGGIGVGGTGILVGTGAAVATKTGVFDGCTAGTGTGVTVTTTVVSMQPREMIKARITTRTFREVI
jgi:hypothetical protein